MKKLNKILLLAGLVFAAVGCDKDQLGATFTGEGEDAQTAYFAQKSVSETFETTAAGDQTVYVKLLRQNAQGDLTVGLDVTMNDATAAFYEIPASVSFKAGEYGVSIPVSIHNVENYTPGVTYAAKIEVVNPDHEAVEGSVAIAAKYASVTVSTSKVLNWVPVYKLKDPTKLLSTSLTEADYVVGPDGAPLKQTGTYTYTFWWGGDDPGLTLERAEGTTIFRINNWGGGINLLFTVNPDKKVAVDGKEYASLSITEQFSGTTNGSGGPEVYVADMLEYANSTYFQQYPCYWDGERTFVFNLMYYIEAGYFDMPTVEIFVLDE